MILPEIPPHSPCRMHSTRPLIHTFPILTSPIPCNWPDFRNLLRLAAHKIMKPGKFKLHNQSLWGMCEDLGFHHGFSIVIALLAVMGKIFLRSWTNLMSKAFELLINWLVAGYPLKNFQIGLRLAKVLPILSYNMQKKIWHWLEMEILQWAWSQLQILILNEYFDDLNVLQGEGKP